MRLVLLICALLALPLLLGLAPPKPKVSAVGVRLTVAPDSSLVLEATATLSGALQAPDSVRWTVYRNTADTLVATAKGKALTQRFEVQAPAYGATVQYLVYARVYRLDTPSGRFQGDTAAYTRPAAPMPDPPTVETVKALIVTPASLTLSGGQSGQLCAMVEWSNGERTRVIPWPAACEPAFLAWVQS